MAGSEDETRFAAGLADLRKGLSRRALGMFRTQWLGMASAWVLCFGLGLPLPVAAAVHTLVGLTVVLAIVSSVDHRWWPLAVTEGA